MLIFVRKLVFSILFIDKDRSKFTGYVGRVSGKISLEKSLHLSLLVQKSPRPLIFSKRKSCPPYFFRKEKELLAPVFISSKNSLIQNYEIHFVCIILQKSEHTPESDIQD